MKSKRLRDAFNIIEYNQIAWTMRCNCHANKHTNTKACNASAMKRRERRREDRNVAVQIASKWWTSPPTLNVQQNKSIRNAYDGFDADNNSLGNVKSKNASYYSILQSFYFTSFSHFVHIPFNFYLFASYLPVLSLLFNVWKHKSIIIILLALCRAVLSTSLYRMTKTVGKGSKERMSSAHKAKMKGTKATTEILWKNKKIYINYTMNAAASL